MKKIIVNFTNMTEEIPTWDHKAAKLAAINGFLAGLVKTARQTFMNIIENTYGKDSESFKSAENLPEEFFKFMVEYTFAAVENDYENGRTQPNVFLDREVLATISTHIVKFSYLMITPAAKVVAAAFEQRIDLLDKCGWFSSAMPVCNSTMRRKARYNEEMLQIASISLTDITDLNTLFVAPQKPL